VKIFLLVMGIAAALNLSGAEPPKRSHSWNPFRLAKALDKKLGEVTIELSSVKSGKPLGSEQKRDDKQIAPTDRIASREMPQSVPVPLPAGQ
jgi:hypothetical protein